MAESSGDDVYAVKLSGKGIAVDMEIDRTLARRILNLILSGPEEEAEEIATASPGPSASPKTTDRVLSLREYLDQREAGSKPEQILAIANYMLETENFEDVGRDEVKARFSTAREPLPANFPRDLSTTLRNGWLAEVHGKPERYYVTQSGAQALSSNFKVAPRRSTSAKRRPSSKDEN